jgi:GntR family transcriptional regulator
VPAETELCRTYDLARSTVRETFRILDQQRLIRLVPRRGAFVNDTTDNRWMLQVTQGFLETQAHSPNAMIETTVIRADVEVLPPPAAVALELPEGASGVVLERVRQVNGVPAMHSTNWLPAHVGAVLVGRPVLEGRISLNATLRSAGLQIFSARREVTAPADTARRPELTKSATVLRIRSLSRDAAGRPFDYYEFYVRSDVVTISVDAEAPGEVMSEAV